MYECCKRATISNIASNDKKTLNASLNTYYTWFNCVYICLYVSMDIVNVWKYNMMVEFIRFLLLLYTFLYHGLYHQKVCGKADTSTCKTDIWLFQTNWYITIVFIILCLLFCILYDETNTKDIENWQAVQSKVCHAVALYDHFILLYYWRCCFWWWLVCKLKDINIITMGA